MLQNKKLRKKKGGKPISQESRKELIFEKTSRKHTEKNEGESFWNLKC